MGNIETSVRDWATEAADAYLKRGADLSSSILKIATRESLNREKVARIVEEANRQVFLNLFEKSADKTFTFPLADTDKIVQPSKTASDNAADSMVRLTPLPKKEMAKTASQDEARMSFEGKPIQVAWDYLEKATLGVEVIREKAAMDQEKLIQAETDFCKTAQNMVALEGHTYEGIFATMAGLRPSHAEKIALLLKVAAAHQGKGFKVSGMEKFAGAAVDGGEHDVVSQISCSGMPVEVVNGSHSLVVALDTLIDQETEADRAKRSLKSADDTVKYLRREVHNYIARHRYA